MNAALFKVVSFLIGAISILQLSAQQNNFKNSFAFTHVTIIDVAAKDERHALIPNQTVIISGNRINAVGNSEKVQVPKNATVINASGKFLIPGLCDMHVHIFTQSKGNSFPNDWYFPLFIANGITGVRDMWTKPEDMKLVSDWRSQLAKELFIGPRILEVGTLVDGPGGVWPTADIARTPNEGRALVRKIKDSGVDFVKTYSSLKSPVYFAIIDEAKKQHITFAGHVPFEIDAAESSDAGQRSIEHLTQILESCSSKEAEILKVPNGGWNDSLIKMMLDTYDESKCRKLFAKFVKNNTWQVPTLSILFRAQKSDFTNEQWLQYVPVSDAVSWKQYAERKIKFTPGIRSKRFQAYSRLVGEMQQAGVKIMAGTDVGNQFIYPGFSLHDELSLLVQAGLTPIEALQTATINPAKFLYREKDMGTIKKSKLADLILLDANPLDDIHNTQKINAVIVNGKYLSRADLDKLLLEAEVFAKKH